MEGPYTLRQRLSSGNQSMRKCAYRSQLRELPKQNVMLTGEESIWLPRPFVWC